MKTQRGFVFLPFLMANWQLLLIGLLVLGVIGYYAHCEHVKKDRDKIIAVMEVQIEKNKVEKIERDNISKAKETDNAKRYANLDRRYAASRQRLRDGSGKAESLSSAAAVVGCPDRQGDVAGGFQRFEEGILGLLERGDRAIERTVTCKAWLDEQAKVKQ